MQFAAENDLLEASEFDARNERGEVMVSDDLVALRTARTLLNYQKKLPVADSLLLTDRGRKMRAWYGFQWQRHILDLTAEEELIYDRMCKQMTLDHRREQVAFAMKMNGHQREIERMAREIWKMERALEGLGTDAASAATPRDSSLAALLEEAPPPARPAKSGRKAVLWAVAILGVLGLVATAGGPMMGLSPFDILRQFGLGAAKQAVGDAEPQSLADLYHRSWLAYIEGDHHQAATGAHAILADRETSRFMQGDCFYLLGSIAIGIGDFQVALGDFFEAYNAYGASGAHASQHYAAVEIANAFVELEQYAEAGQWLETALDHYRQDQDKNTLVPNLGNYYLVKVDWAGHLGNRLEALKFAKARLDEAEKSQEKALLAYAFSLLGFWYTANGCPEKGLYYANRASQAAIGLGDDRPVLFNFATRVFVQRSLGIEADPHTEAFILEWARMRNDSRLEYFLNLALRIPIEENQNDCEAIIE